VFPNEEIRVGGQLRRFRLVVPETVDRTKPVPLVVAFHGMLIDSKDVMPKYTKLDELAVKKRFLIVFPAAVDRSWGIAADKVVADLKFFDAILAEVGTRYRVDANRIYVVGMSNGGYFAHLVGKERSQNIAAVCSHSGPLGLQTLLGIRAERKFPVMIVHGEEDRIFPVAFARENRDKYHREGHVVKYVEVPGLNHYWATNSEINEQIWKFFESHTLASE
jgi:polyhydroxybutyrate depolymerase